MIPWLISGSLVDRINRKTIIVVGNGVASLVYLYLTWRVLTQAISVVDLIVGALLLEVRSSFTQPALRAVLGALVPRQLLPKALAFNQGRDATTSLVGPPVGGLLYAIAPWVPLLLDAISYVVNAVAMSLVRRPLAPEPQVASDEEGLRRPLTAGFAWLLRHRILRRTVVSASLSSFGAITLLMTVNLLLVSRHTPPLLLGLVDSAMAVAGLVGAVAAPRFTTTFRPWQLSATTGALFACAAIAMAASPTYPVMLIALTAPFLILPAAVTVQDGYQISVTPDALQGRVSAAAMLLTAVTAPLGPSLAGLLLEHAGPALALLVAGIIMLIAEAVVVSSSEFRHVGPTPTWVN